MTEDREKADWGCESDGLGGGGAMAPPEHEFEAGAIRVGAGDPAAQELEVGGEALHEFLLSAAERGAVTVVPEHVVNGEEVAAGLEPAADGEDVAIAVSGRDGTEERVFEHPAVPGRGLVAEEIACRVVNLPGGIGWRFAAAADGGRCEVEAGGGEAVTGPGADIVTGTAAGD